MSLDCSPPDSSAHSPGKNTSMGCYFLLHSFSTQGLKLCLLNLLPWQAGALPAEPLGKPSNWPRWLQLPLLYEGWHQRGKASSHSWGQAQVSNMCLMCLLNWKNKATLMPPFAPSWLLANNPSRSSFITSKLLQDKTSKGQREKQKGQGV